jgi:hypothetical protein
MGTGCGVRGIVEQEGQEGSGLDAGQLRFAMAGVGSQTTSRRKGGGQARYITISFNKEILSTLNFKYM